MKMERTLEVSAARFGFLAGFVMLMGFLGAGAAQGQGGLSYINEKDGGHIVFGKLSNVSSMPQAMGFMLHTVHTHFEERPEVGKFFQTKGSSSVATFFTLTDKNNTHHALAGMVIVSMPPGGVASAALLYDDSPHFPKSVSLMMKHLDEAMARQGMGEGGPGNGGGNRGGGGTPGRAAPLQQASAPDGSATVGLPAGWRVTGGGGGSIHAEGPSGSQIHYDVQIPVMDPSNPQERQMIQMETQGGRTPLPGMYVALTYGGDPSRALMSAEAQLSQKSRKQAPTYTTSNVKDEGNSPAGHCMRVVGTIDRHDGKGVLAANTVICETQPQNGLWIMTLNQEDVRPEMEAQEQATLEAIGKSFRVNGAVVSQQQQQTISQIHAIGDAATARANASSQWLDQQDANRASANAAYPSSRQSAQAGGGDGQEQHNQDFSNYQRDLSVITDTQTGEHATTYNSWADALVKTDPNRYQYVTTPNLLKGIDY